MFMKKNNEKGYSAEVNSGEYIKAGSSDKINTINQILSTRKEFGFNLRAIKKEMNETEREKMKPKV